MRIISKLIALMIILLFSGMVFAQETTTEEETQTESENQWGPENSNLHVTGYGTTGYMQDTLNKSNGAFNSSITPIFHYGYKDVALMETEFEYKIDETGATQLEMEYATIDLFLNDYVALIVGRFLSPVGFFKQNLHPTWINKLPAAPVGFGHGGAGLSSSTGFQLRGGIPVFETDMRINYAVYLANGPRFVKNVEGTKIEGHFETEGISGADPDPGKAGGGRIGFLPMLGLEIGGSFAAGKLHLLDTDGKTPIGGAVERSFETMGADINYLSTIVSGLRFRAEYIQTNINGVAVSLGEPGKRNTSAWYTEIAYKATANIEPVVRYSTQKTATGLYDTVTKSVETENNKVYRITAGLNYYFEPSILVKIAYAVGETKKDGVKTTDENVYFQLAFGF